MGQVSWRMVFFSLYVVCMPGHARRAVPFCHSVEYRYKLVTAGLPTLGAMPPLAPPWGILTVSAVEGSAESIPVISTPRSGTNTLAPVVSAPTSGAGISTLAPSSTSVSVTLAWSGTEGMALDLCNLLPGRGPSKEVSLSAGIYVGEGLLPVPAKLADRKDQEVGDCGYG